MRTTRTAITGVAAGLAMLGWTGVIVATSPAHAAALASTYPGCDKSLTLTDWWPLRDAPGSTVAVDILRPANSVGLLAGWGPTTPGVTFNGSSARGVGGMLYGPTNITLGTRSWCAAMTIQTRDQLYNSYQFGKSQGAGPCVVGFVKITAAYARVCGTTGSVKIPSLRNYSDGVKHHVAFQRLGDVFTYTVDGVLQGSQTVAVGSVDLDPAHNPLMLLGKFERGVARGWTTTDMLDGPASFLWNVQLAMGSQS